MELVGCYNFLVYDNPLETPSHAYHTTPQTDSRGIEPGPRNSYTESFTNQSYNSWLGNLTPHQNSYHTWHPPNHYILVTFTCLWLLKCLSLTRESRFALIALCSVDSASLSWQTDTTFMPTLREDRSSCLFIYLFIFEPYRGQWGVKLPKTSS